jgi:uncharacterized cupin superfamily protein
MPRARPSSAGDRWLFSEAHYQRRRPGWPVMTHDHLPPARPAVPGQGPRMIVDPATAPTSGEKGLHTLHLSVAGGLTQFGAYLDTLDPGAWSSQRHWHSAEDEFIYLLSGTATLRDDAGMTDLFPGDAVCWPHGQPNGHHLTNRGDVPARWLIVGSSLPGRHLHLSR